jgi:hypothetical protein
MSFGDGISVSPARKSARPAFATEDGWLKCHLGVEATRSAAEAKEISLFDGLKLWLPVA